MTTKSHYEASLQRDIDSISSKVKEMGERGAAALEKALVALTENNRQIAYSVILRDQFIDEAEEQLDRLCLEFLVRQQPVARHLRFVYAALKINNELERIGDYAESIARQVLKLDALTTPPNYEKYTKLAHLSIQMLRDTVKAFIEQDAELARKVMAIEEEADAIRDEINHDLIELRQSEAIPLLALTPLMTIARRYERVADQAKNICEEILYMCTGQYMKHLGSEAFRVLFVDDHNSCRSQLAEAIGNGLQERNFVFSSAGITPQPIDPRVVSFLQTKGIDISRQHSNALEQVPNLEHHQVIVALSKEARAAFPSPPTKTVTLDWSIEDPSKVQGSEAEVNEAYEKAFNYINSHIRDLVKAMLGKDTKTKTPNEK